MRESKVSWISWGTPDHNLMSFSFQVFTKGLNLHNSNKKQDTATSDEEDAADMEEKHGAPEDENEKEAKVNSSNAKSHVSRSQTIGNLELTKTGDAQGENLTSNQKSQSTLDFKVEAPLPLAPQPLVLPKLNLTNNNFGRRGFAPPQEEVESLPPVERPSSMTPGADYLQLGHYEKRTIIALRGRPADEIFPKLTSLVFKYHSGDGESENEAEYNKRPRKQPPVKRQPTKIRITPLKEFNSVKLYQKLTNNLPSSLLKRAEQQIHELSNSEGHYERKQQLLQKNKEASSAVVQNDTRWQKLQASLGDTHGVSLKWRKMPGIQSWVIIKQ